MALVISSVDIGVDISRLSPSNLVSSIVALLQIGSCPKVEQNCSMISLSGGLLGATPYGTRSNKLLAYAYLFLL